MANRGVSVESTPYFYDEDEANNSSSPELGGRAAHKLRRLGEIPVVRQGRTRGEQMQLDLDSVALFVEKAVATELQEWLSVSVMHDCLTRIVDGLCNPLLLGAVNDTEHSAVSGIDFARVIYIWLKPLLDSRNGFGALISENAFVTTDLDCSEFPHISKIKGPSYFCGCRAFAV